MARKNKTYQQQFKYYGAEDYGTLAGVFMMWLECGNESAKSMQETFREGNRECREQIMNELKELSSDYSTFVNIFMFGHK